jgi:hypothetical protein
MAKMREQQQVEILIAQIWEQQEKSLVPDHPGNISERRCGFRPECGKVIKHAIVVVVKVLVRLFRLFEYDHRSFGACSVSVKQYPHKLVAAYHKIVLC